MLLASKNLLEMIPSLVFKYIKRILMIQYKTDTHTDEKHQKHHKHNDEYVKTNR